MTSRPAARGASFERLIAGYLRTEFGDHIGRLRAGAARDLGDLAGVPLWTFECKAYVNLQAAVASGIRDLRVEQANAGTPHGAVIVKRAGTTDPSRQLFLMELGQAVPVIRATQRSVA